MPTLTKSDQIQSHPKLNLPFACKALRTLDEYTPDTGSGVSPLPAKLNRVRCCKAIL